MSRDFRIFLMVFSFFFACCASECIAQKCRHDLTVELRPESRSIFVKDTIRLDVSERESVSLRLPGKARVESLTVDGAASGHSLNAGRLLISLPSPAASQVAIAISYEAVFDDPIPQEPMNFDNPGFGVTGSITENGAFLLPDSGWYPQVSGSREEFDIKIIAPRGMYAVTAGELVKHEDEGEKSISAWRTGAIGQAPALSAGRYVIRSRLAGRVPVYTYFFPDSDSLSRTYLDAAAEHLAFYEKLHGPYPFPKFAVVENSFPTGYGFPSYTLLGTTVLRLAFIPQTSLRHEIAHSWWGNGVLVDYDSGNWCEGLTTYVADHLAREAVSPEEGKIYRRQILQDYATLAASGMDFPLKQFTSRTNPASRAVGYGKAAFVFHMIRHRIGDEAFYRSLRQVYRDRLFAKTSWNDLQEAFIRTGGWDARDARTFFDQWISRPGAPVLNLKSARHAKKGENWTVTGFLTQSPPFYDLPVELALSDKSETTAVAATHARGPLTRFSLQSKAPPARLVADPGVNLFRLLAPREIPATVNSLKAARNLIAVAAEGVDPELLPAFANLLAGLGRDGVKILDENQIDPRRLKTTDLLLFGLPRSHALASLLDLSPRAFNLNVISEADCVFAVFADPGRNGRLTALFLPVPGAQKASLFAAAGKLTHYGKYSYLAFSDGTVGAKGVWDAAHSPLVFDFVR